jgi:hypothetical protein
MENTPTKFPRRRTRMISFRVSDGEFEELKTKSEGAGSISEFVRLTVCGSGTVQNNGVTQGIGQLRENVQQLSADVRRVTELLESSSPLAHGQPARKDSGE